MPTRTLLPSDDLYARLELPPDASFEAIEIAWRALLRRHHPDVAGAAGLEPAKAINVAHDWLSDPVLRERYDRERGIARTGATRRAGTTDRRASWTGPQPPRPAAPARRPVEAPAARLARFLRRLERLTADDLDRLDCGEPAPIAFAASIERFLTDEQAAALTAAEAAVAERVPAASWARPAVRAAILGQAHEIVLSEFLDEHLDEPFRGRVRERLTRGWDAAVGRPRHGPGGRDVALLVRRIEALDADGLRWLASTVRPDLGPEPWPRDTTPEEDESLRVSSMLAGRDVALVVADPTVDRATLARARRAATRLAHLVVLRHAFPATEWTRLTEPWRSLLAGGRDEAPPAVRRRR